MRGFSPSNSKTEVLSQYKGYPHVVEDIVEMNTNELAKKEQYSSQKRIFSCSTGNPQNYAMHESKLTSGGLLNQPSVGFQYKSYAGLKHKKEQTSQPLALKSDKFTRKHVVEQVDFVENENVSSKHRFSCSNNQPTVRSCLLYTSPSPRDGLLSRMPSSA